jgi:hypothetical protein
VPDVNETAQHERLKRLQEFASRLDAGDTNTSEESLDVENLMLILKLGFALGEFAPWRIHFLADAGFHTDVGYVVSATRFDTGGAAPGWFLRIPLQRRQQGRAGL